MSSIYSIKNMIKPKRLSRGDTIALISPASSPSDLTRIKKGAGYFEKLGYKVKIGGNVGKSYGYLAGTDSERLEDFHNMFADKEVKAIICVRGGYGTGRLLKSIDYTLIKNNPKIFVGYSDITALQLAMYEKAGLVSFAGPMAAVDFYSEVNGYTEENFWKITTNAEPFGKVENPEGEDIIFTGTEDVEGPLAGGNLALVTSLMGSEYIPGFEGKILFLEDVGEEPYRIDRMLNQLDIAGVFDKINGLILGRFEDCEGTDEKGLTIDEVFDHYFSKLNVPVVKNLRHGHLQGNLTLPFGILCKIYPKTNTLEIAESAVK